MERSWRPETEHYLISSSLFSVCQTHGQDLSTISPASIFESMFQSPEHAASQDDSQQTGAGGIGTVWRGLSGSSPPPHLLQGFRLKVAGTELAAANRTSAPVLTFFCAEKCCVCRWFNSEAVAWCLQHVVVLCWR